MGKIICMCGLVEETEITSALKKGAESIAEIQQLTGAGRSCGRCLPEIDELLVRFEKRKAKNRQRKLDFGI